MTDEQPSISEHPFIPGVLDENLCAHCGQRPNHRIHTTGHAQ